MRASIDIGSNTLLLLVGEYENGVFKIEESVSSITGLARGVEKTQLLSSRGIEESFRALKKYREIIEKKGGQVDETLVVATEASRMAGNFVDFQTRVRNQIGFSITLLSPQGEAYYCSRGISLGESQLAKTSVAMDLGGASTEIMSFKSNPFVFEKYVSLKIGSVRATEWLENQVFEQKVNQVFEHDLEGFKTRQLIGVGGTMTSLAAMMLGLREYSDQAVEGKKFKIGKLKKFVEKLEKSSPEEILDRFPVIGKRAGVIIGGGITALKVAQALEAQELMISIYGPRYGLLSVEVLEDKYVV
jgi:exopolyphosphatase/guanosine-5'-triphosphate,3'-diphosphate pyrophosphatase